jgi:hypothetical protein
MPSVRASTIRVIRLDGSPKEGSGQSFAAVRDQCRGDREYAPPTSEEVTARPEETDRRWLALRNTAAVAARRRTSAAEASTGASEEGAEAERLGVASR